MLDCLIDNFVQVKGITQVVVNVRQVIIDFQSFLVVRYSFVRLAGVVVCVTEADEGLKLFVVKL